MKSTKIIKKTIAIILVLVLSLSMVVGMSASASAATKPERVTGLYIQGFGESPYYLNIVWNASQNANKYVVTVYDFKNAQKPVFFEKTVYSYGANKYSAQLDGVKAADKFRYQIMVTPFNGSVSGDSTYLAPSRGTGWGDLYVPYMAKATNLTISYPYLTWTTPTVTAYNASTNKTKTYVGNEKYQITVSDTTQRGNQINTIRTTGSKSLNLSKILKTYHRYTISVRSFINDSVGQIRLSDYSTGLGNEFYFLSNNTIYYC